jgi:hypothetical protein
MAAVFIVAVRFVENHGVVACAGTQKQHKSGRYDLLADRPFEGKEKYLNRVPKQAKDRDLSLS